MRCQPNSPMTSAFLPGNVHLSGSNQQHDHRGWKKARTRPRLFPWPEQQKQPTPPLTSSGWWFQTWLLFSIIYINIWDNPSHWRSYFSRWLKPPTSLCFWGSLLFIERFETRKDVPLSLKESLVFGVRIAAAFKHFDKDGSGVLEHQEISSAQGIIFRAELAKHLGMGPDLWSAQWFFLSQPSIHGGTTSTTSTTMLWPEAHPSGVQIPLCLPGMVLGGVQQCLGSAGEADHGAMVNAVNATSFTSRDSRVRTQLLRYWCE